MDKIFLLNEEELLKHIRCVSVVVNKLVSRPISGPYVFYIKMIFCIFIVELFWGEVGEGIVWIISITAIKSVAEIYDQNHGIL